MGMEQRRMIGEYLPLRDVMERLFEGSVITPQVFGGQSTFPPVDLFVTDDDVIVEVAVPAVKQDDLSISVTGETVTISGEVKRDTHGDKGHAYAQEIFQGKFQRAFRLPIQIDADKAGATYEHGLLTLRLPKAEATKPHKIQIGKQQEFAGLTHHILNGGVEKETVGTKAR
ncbi:MAG: Hsp20/alpha crystallin family protein [Chloroflexota bacterium]